MKTLRVPRHQITDETARWLARGYTVTTMSPDLVALDRPAAPPRTFWQAVKRWWWSGFIGYFAWQAVYWPLVAWWWLPLRARRSPVRVMIQPVPEPGPRP